MAIELIERKNLQQAVGGEGRSGGIGEVGGIGGVGGGNRQLPVASNSSHSIYTKDLPTTPNGGPITLAPLPPAPLYVAGTTWVFDGDDEQSMSISGEASRAIRVSARIIGRSGSVGSSSSKTNSGHGFAHTAPSSSSTRALVDESSNNGIESFLTDFETDEATIMSAKSTVNNDISSTNNNTNSNNSTNDDDNGNTVTSNKKIPLYGKSSNTDTADTVFGQMNSMHISTAQGKSDNDENNSVNTDRGNIKNNSTADSTNDENNNNNNYPDKNKDDKDSSGNDNDNDNDAFMDEMEELCS